jgi:ketosteroid isomerase-like protein
MTFAKPSSSPQFGAVRQFYEAITRWDFDALEKLFSEEYVHKTLPASADDPPKNKAQGIAHARAVGAMLGHAPLGVSQRARRVTPCL